MNVLYVYNHFPDIYQGYLHVLLDEIRQIIPVSTLSYVENKEADYNIKSYGFKDLYQRLLYKFRLSNQASYDLKLFNKFDIVHIQQSYLWPKVLNLNKSNDRPKIVITLRGGDTYVKPWISEKWKYFYAESYNLIDAFVVMSQHQKDYLLRWGVPENKVHIISISFGEKNNILPKYPNDNTLKLVSVFRMTWEKNIEGTLILAKKLKEKNVNFKYDIYGYGSDIGQLYYLIDKFNLNECVFVQGKVPNNTILEKLQEYDFFVQLSISESLGMSVIEAQSKGLPCIVSDSGGLSEVVIKNKSAVQSFYNDYDFFANEIVRIWNDKNLYFNYSKEAINFANKNFSIDKEATALVELYDLITSS